MLIARKTSFKKGMWNGLGKIGKRVGEMEFLRFIFSIIIVFHHSRNFIGNETALFLNGSFAVEFFFILSGFLMMKSVSKMSEQPGNLGAETFLFIKKKYLALYPDVIISWIIGAVVTIVIGQLSLMAIANLVRDGVWEMSLLTMTGLRLNTINDALWYLSSMLLAMAILFPLLRKYKNTAKLVIIPLITVLIFGYFAAEHSSIRSPFDWLGVTYRGNLRAIADMGVGIISCQITEVFQTKKLTVFFKSLLTGVKYVGILGLVMYMYFIRDAARLPYDMFCIVAIAVVIGLIFSRQTYGERLFNNGVVGFLGKFSLPLYLSHYYWADLMIPLLPENTGKAKATVIYFALSFATAAVVMALSAVIKRHKPFGRLKPLFIKGE